MVTFFSPLLDISNLGKLATNLFLSERSGAFVLGTALCLSRLRVMWQIRNYQGPMYFGTRSHAESRQWFQQCHLDAILSCYSSVDAQSHHPAWRDQEGLWSRVSLGQIQESSCWLSWTLLVRSDLLSWLECKHLLQLSFVSHVSFIMAFCIYKHVSSMREKCDNFQAPKRVSICFLYGLKLR